MSIKFPTIMIPQGGGAFLLKPGAPVPEREEVTVRQFSRATGLSITRIYELCEEGSIKCRRLSPSMRSKRLIPAGEIARYLAFE